MTQEEQQDTHESDALSGDVQFDQGDVEAVGDPAAAMVDADTSVHATTEEPIPEPAPAFEPPDPTYEQTPSAADQRGAAQREGPPIIPIVGAFVGAFVGAKLLGKLSGGDD